jgi:hypothetical protein
MAKKKMPLVRKHYNLEHEMYKYENCQISGSDAKKPDNRGFPSHFKLIKLYSPMYTPQRIQLNTSYIFNNVFLNHFYFNT